MTLKTIFLALGILVLCTSHVVAQQDNNDRALDLFAAYQGGYFQVVAVSCFQLYASTGIIDSDFEVGVISGELAQSALDRSRLLLSVCTTSLEEIRVATPVDDVAAFAEIERLGNLLARLTNLFDALNNKFLYPSEENIAIADKALAELEFTMDEYVGPINE